MADPAILPHDASCEDGRASREDRGHRALEVVMVEDGESAGIALDAAVRTMGHRCRLASSGWDALRMHTARKADVIVSPWGASDMEGEELCKRVRALDGDGYTYLLFTSGHATKRDVVEAVRAGADGCLVEPVDLDELEALLIVASRVVDRYRTLTEQNVGLRRDSQALFRSARVDTLTEVANRLRLEEDLEALQAEVSRYRRNVCVAMCDLDEFKCYNDHYGHVAGDEALRQIAQAISQSLRQADRVYRYGGEEFLVLLSEQTPENALAAMERVRRAVESLGLPQAPAAKSPAMTVSIGLAAITPERDALLRGSVPESNPSGRDVPPDSDLSVRAAIVRADRALYRAKADGRNRIVIEPLGSGVYSRFALPSQEKAPRGSGILPAAAAGGPGERDRGSGSLPST